MDSASVSAYAASISAVTAVILAWMTDKYVRLTGRMVSEMKASRQPIVFIDIEIHQASEVLLIIGNSGEAPARHCQFEIDDGIPWKGKPWFAPAQLPALRDGIPYLAPGRSLRFHLGSLDWEAATKKGGWLNAKIHFEGAEGRKFIHPANIDLRRYNGISTDTFAKSDEAVVEALGELVRIANVFALRADVATFTHVFCVACAKPIPFSAKKCFECGEWQSETEKGAQEAGVNAPAS